jgi:hypothetical protein
MQEVVETPDTEEMLKLCTARPFVNRLTGLPVSPKEADKLGHIEGRHTLRLIAPCIPTYLKKKVVFLAVFQAKNSKFTVMSDGLITLYIYLGAPEDGYTTMRMRIRAGSRDVEEARYFFLNRPSISSPAIVSLMRNKMKDIEEIPLLYSFSEL